MSLEAKINALVEENRKLKEVLEKTTTHISELEGKIGERVDELVELRMTDELRKEVVNRVVRGDRKEGMKMPAPSTFSGNGMQVDTFLRECELYFRNYTNVSAQDKILIALSYMKEGKAADWVNA
jgi:hypothetical protein